MRISMDRNDPGYDEACRLGVNVRCVRILLDGQYAGPVITADDTAGIVVRYRRAVNGKIIRAPDGKTIMTEEVLGAVRIELIAGADGSWPHAIPRKPPADFAAHLRF